MATCNCGGNAAPAETTPKGDSRAFHKPMISELYELVSLVVAMRALGIAKRDEVTGDYDYGYAIQQIGSDVYSRLIDVIDTLNEPEAGKEVSHG